MRTRMQLSPNVAPSLKLRTRLIYAGVGIALAAIIGVAVFIYLNLGNTENAMAAGVTYSSNLSGNWTTGVTWQGGTAPPTANINGDQVVVRSNNTVTRSGNITALNDFILTIQSNGRLTINGNLTVDNNFTLNNSGTLVITGTLIANNDAIINNFAGGSITVNGNITFGNNADFSNDGVLIAGSNVTFGNNGIFNGTGTASISGSGCSAWTGSGSCNNGPVLMPVELLSFTAKDDGNGSVEIRWETATEKNSDYFTIQRSKDGKTYSDVGAVKGSGTTTEKTKYDFVDSNPLENKLYYRLAQTDYDGATETFAPVLVNIELKQKDISVYPNPLVGKSVTVTIPNGEEGTLSIIDHRGKTIITRKVDAESSSVEIEFDNDLAPGLYHVSYKSGSIVKNAKLVKK